MLSADESGLNRFPNWLTFIDVSRESVQLGTRVPLVLFTPAGAYIGRIEEVQRIRQAAMALHYAGYPERDVNGARGQVNFIAGKIATNPDDGQPAEAVPS